MLEVEYPKQLPVASLNVLLSKLRGNATNAQAVHAAWVILGYGASLGFPVDQIFGGAEVQLKEEAAIESLLYESEHEEGVAKGPLASVAIGVVIKLALRLLSEAIK